MSSASSYGLRTGRQAPIYIRTPKTYIMRLDLNGSEILRVNLVTGRARITVTTATMQVANALNRFFYLCDCTRYEFSKSGNYISFKDTRRNIAGLIGEGTSDTVLLPVKSTLIIISKVRPYLSIGDMIGDFNKDKQEEAERAGDYQVIQEEPGPDMPF